MDDKEDGELSGSDVEVYTPIVRPDASQYRMASRNDIFSEDEDSDRNLGLSDDSDSDVPSTKRIRTCGAKLPTTKCVDRMETSEQNGNIIKKRSDPRKNNIWSNVLQEEAIMQSIGGVDLKKKRNNDRNVESYEYPRPFEVTSESEDEERAAEDKILKIKRKKYYEGSSRPRVQSRLRKVTKLPHLRDIQDNPEWTDEELAAAIATSLNETKADIIVKVVEILGRSKALDVYKKTREIENADGILVLDGSRRRTSGGVFLLLLKSFDGVTRKDLSEIFYDDLKVMQQAKKRKRDLRKRKEESAVAKEYPPMEESITKSPANAVPEDGLLLQGVFSDDPGGTKCPGSTPVTSPHGSDSDENHRVIAHPVPLKEACEKAALEIEERECDLGLAVQEEMDVI